MKPEKALDVIVNGPQRITEADGVHKDWYEQAKRQTLETLPFFLKELTTGYQHDYGTICHAMAAAAVAAASAIDASPEGGITGFQSGAVMWEFIRSWSGKEGPLRLIEFEHMLYPQYEDRFVGRTISKGTWTYIQTKARELLAGDLAHVHPDIILHWTNIVGGMAPFGYSVTAEIT